MRIELETPNTDPVAAGNLRKVVEHHFRRSLEHVRFHVDRVLVRLADLNGPRGGMDKLCTAHVHIIGQRPVLVRDVRADIGTAIARAADRAGLTSQRRVRHRQMAQSGKLRREGMRHPGAMLASCLEK